MTTLIIDVSSLAYKFFYAMPNLNTDGIQTEVVYPFFRAILNLQDLFATQSIVFCFDSEKSKRKEIFSGYKASRREKWEQLTKSECLARQSLFTQLDRLRTKYLPTIGFRNILWQKGYEADDLIASVCDCLPRGENGVIVSTDSDLYQLLREDRIIVWKHNRQRPVTEGSFIRHYGIGAAMWPDVKALAGCTSDDIPGVQGVGEVKAIRFLTGGMNPDTNTYRRIISCNGLWRRNLDLTRLPFPGTSKWKPRVDVVTKERWEKVLRKLKMPSLEGRVR